MTRTLNTGALIRRYRDRALRFWAAWRNGRFEERLAERTPTAQERRGTPRQAFGGASAQIQVTVKCLAADSHVEASRNGAVGSVRRGIPGDRHAVCGLGFSQILSTELPEAFSRIRDEAMHRRRWSERPNFRVISGGSRKPLHPEIRDEVYWIGREALINAFRHAHAETIEIEVQYWSNSLRVIVRDDGCGIEPQLLDAGRDGQSGVRGMRERAEGIGSRLRLWSGRGRGTEVELSVPGHLAFRDPKAASSSMPEYLEFVEAAARR